MGDIAAVLIVILVMMVIARVDFLGEKYQCEKNLPRNVYCAWAAPVLNDTQQESNND